MQDPPRSASRSSLRTILFAAMAIGILISLAFPFGVPPVSKWTKGRAERYGRAGDTFVRMFYLARIAGFGEEESRQFLDQAHLHYVLSVEAAPEDPQTLTSLALVFSALGRREDAVTTLYALLRQDLPKSERQGLIATLRVMASTEPSPEDVENAASFLRRSPAGLLVLARAYEHLGRTDAAEQVWRAARAQALGLAVPVAAMVAVCGLMLLAGLIGLALFIMGRVREARAGAAHRPAAPPPATWRAREAVEALILWLFVAQACRLALGAALPAERTTGALALLLPGLAAGIAGITWVWLASPRGTRLGWRLSRGWRWLVAGISAAGLFALPILGLYQIILNLYLRYALAQQVGLGTFPEEHPLVPVITGAPVWPTKVVLIVAACAIVPALEETLFRGILYGALRKDWPFAPAAIASGLVFAVAHLSAPPLLPYLLLGVLFAYLYERYGSLLAPWAAHGAFNGFNLAILLTLYH